MRRRARSSPAGEMPEELREYPFTPEEIDRWLLPGEQMPADWDFGGEVWWRPLTAQGRWAEARRAWRVANDPTYWWHPDRVATRQRSS